MRGLGCRPPCSQKSAYNFSQLSTQAILHLQMQNQPQSIQYCSKYLLEKNPCISGLHAVQTGVAQGSVVYLNEVERKKKEKKNYQC